jgi:hypothetical protein
VIFLLTYTPMEYIIESSRENKHRKVEIKMTRNGKDYTLTQEVLDEIATYMNDEIREDLHFDMASSCEPEEFLRAYVERDSEFENLLRIEFGIEL